MTLSSTTLAIGTSAGSLLVASLSALFGGLMTALTFLGIRHHARVFAWMRKNRDTDEDAKDLEDAAGYLKETFEKLCELAQKPCRATELEPLRRLRHLINASAAQLEVLHTELRTVAGRIDDYLSTGLPELAGTARVPCAEHDAQLERAMKQEHARIELEHAVSRAQQRIRALRKP
ncbi:hypothetical protein [Streptomyces sp. NPDC046862]|uniref:hypothetical protein n=1 Tax=Streptomyces sp. NPDC046862 TaxID=3154603 RepID=UPI0034573019